MEFIAVIVFNLTVTKAFGEIGTHSDWLVPGVPRPRPADAALAHFADHICRLAAVESLFGQIFRDFVFQRGWPTVYSIIFNSSKFYGPAIIRRLYYLSSAKNRQYYTAQLRNEMSFFVSGGGSTFDHTLPNQTYDKNAVLNMYKMCAEVKNTSSE